MIDGASVPRIFFQIVVPIIVFYLICQKYIVKGVMTGAVKG